MAGFESLYPAMADMAYEGEDDLEIVPLAKKRRLMLTMGPKWRPEHETPFMATNAKIIESEKASGNENVPLIDFIMDDIAQGVQYHSNLDVMLEDYIHPDSPKLITVALKNLDVNGDVDPAMGDVPIPLYLCLLDEQFKQILAQMGFQDGPENSLFVVEMNRRKNEKFGPSLCKRSEHMETFINETVGRFGRYNTKSDSSWDSQQQFFQPIRFKIRIGPRNSVTVVSTKKVSRGRGKRSKQENPEAPAPGGDVKNSQQGQFQPYRKPNELQESEKERTAFLDNIQEDGAQYAALTEHTFELTSHTLVSPKFRAALKQAGTYVGIDFEDTTKSARDRADRAMNNGRTHLVTLVEAELKEGETSVSRYTDPRAMEDLKKRRIFAAFQLRKLLGTGP